MEQTGASNHRKAEFLMNPAVQRSLVPTYDVCRLKCELCKRYLSCSPLRVLPTGKTICGRCGNVQGSITQLLLMELFEKKRFPCIYDNNGCTATVQFNHLDIHERYCRYRTLKCPLAPIIQCNKMIIITDVLDHLWEEHNGYIYGSPVTFQIGIEESSQHKFIMLFENRFFENLLTICTERSRIRHDVIKDNFPFDRSNYRFFLEEQGANSTTRLFSGNSGTLPLDSETMYVTVRILATMPTDDSLAYRSPCVNCMVPTRHYYFDDTKKGWLCYACASTKRLCANSPRGCIHRDRDQNLIKHRQFFCEYAGFCSICKKLMTHQNLLDHYNDEHSDIMLPENKLFTLKCNSQKDGWFIINATFGKVLCRFLISRNSMIITMYTALRSDELHCHTCKVILNNTNLEKCDFTYISEPVTQYNAVYDWQIQLTGKNFKNVFQNGECSILPQFIKGMPIKTVEWLNDVFQRVNDTSHTILLN